MIRVLLAVFLVCFGWGQAYAKTVTLNTATTNCAYYDIETNSGVNFDCFAQLKFDTAANANNAYLFTASLTYHSDGRIVGEHDPGTYEPYIFEVGCIELCFWYSSDSNANLVSLRFYHLYNGCTYCVEGSFNSNGTGLNYFFSQAGATFPPFPGQYPAIYMNSSWVSVAPAPVPLSASAILLVSGILSLLYLGRFSKKPLAVA